MLAAVARFSIRRRRLVLVSALVVFLAGGVFGGKVADSLSSGGFEDPGAESTEASRIIKDEFGEGDANLVLLVTAKSGSVDDPAVAEVGRQLTERVSSLPHVSQAVSYWTLFNAPPLRGREGDQALVLARIEGTQDEVNERVEEIAPAVRFDGPLVSVGVTGFGQVFSEVGTTIEADLRRSESFAFPLTLLLLVLVFGGLVAAGLPLGLGVLSIVGTFVVLRVLASVTEVSIYALNMTTALGLGLAIDYSLFILSRYREEQRHGFDTETAIVRSVMTAGRTVVFSGLTVAASLAALIVFPLAFLRSFAYAGVAVVALAALASVVVLPAMLAGLGARIDSLTLFRRRPAPELGEGFWHRAALAVMRRPVISGGAVVILLLVLGAPFLNLDVALPDDRVLPPSAPARKVTDQIRANFSSQEAGALSVVAAGIGDPSARTEEIADLASRLSALPRVSRVDAITGVYVNGAKAGDLGPLAARFNAPDGTWLSVVPSVEPVSSEGEALVAEIRSTPAPFEVLVGGPSAQLVDTKDSLFGLLPLALAVIAVVTFVVLFLMFGSVLVPLKALVLNILSLSATFGAMVYVFQEGHFSGILNFTPTGTLDATTPILMFCIAFGLSMDYEVFLLSRIKEEYDHSGDNTASVAAGLERTGRIVTAAAALLAVVFISFVSSDVTFIKLFGLGLTMAVLVDATLIRAVLVPSFMKLAGDANWWAPAPLRRFHDRFGFSESVVLEPPPSSVAASPPTVDPEVKPGAEDGLAEAPTPEPTAPRPSKPPAKKSVAKKARPAKKAVAKKAAPVKKAVAKKAAPVKKAVAKKAAPVKKAVAKNAAPAKRTAAKKAVR